ncbi:nucleophile aminohydrolase [Ochromonadaceae sp. CCMP2298]|nr:nucleophile aminohydrolase [Ochromonadaceae sp. CCMP2298]|mmetsp:Transcript_31227/g.69578  ORF Transcript_31227/g.69578 Transcript_31227/m.69578 type:complete len:326 (-) Transcript_31227:73-1050(-)
MQLRRSALSGLRPLPGLALALLLTAALLLGLLPPCGGREFDPYSDNGGTVLGLAGSDYALVAADTRLSEQYFIRSRSLSRLSAPEEGLLFCGAGCWADTLALSKELRLAALAYQWEHGCTLRIEPLSHLLSSELYSRRFFPYYSFCLVAGIDKTGAGAVFRYDAVGSSERVRCACLGKGEKLLQPLLDELTAMERDDSMWTLAKGGQPQFVSQGAPLPKTLSNADEAGDGASGSGGGLQGRLGALCVGLSAEQACAAVVRAFRAAAEREISVGDGLDVWLLRRRPEPTPPSEPQSQQQQQRGLSPTSPRAYSYHIEKRSFPLPQH